MNDSRGTDSGRAGANEGPALWPVAGRLLAELGPLIVFFGVYKLWGFMLATAAFVVAMVATTGISWYSRRRLPLLPAFAAAVALVTGGLTLGLGEEYFLKIRPTLMNGIYGLTLLGSLLTNKPLLKMVLEGPLMLEEKAWRSLTWRTGLFLLAIAVANEVIWRTQPTELWVNFKVFAVLPLDLAFILSQWPFVKHHWRAGTTKAR